MILSSAKMKASQGLDDSQICVILSPTHADFIVFGTWLALRAV
jgi:hypothetical protein